MSYSDNDNFFSSFRFKTVAIRILFRWLVSVGAVTSPPKEYNSPVGKLYSLGRFLI